MKKQTKFVAVLSAAALLAMGASMTSFAAGWEKDEAGAWHYYDSSDDMVTSEWKKDGNKWFYLDDDGNMATNQWVESDYYVGEDGAMVQNGWVKTLPDDEDVDNPEDTGEHWYYFNAKGKKVTGQKKNIGGKTYFFNEDGEMLSGWQTPDKDDTVYYLGTEDEGWAVKSQWRWLEKSGIDDDEEDEVTGHAVLGCSENDDCDDEGWYWFDAAGKMYHGSSLKTINGKKFMFNDHGQMLYEWLNDAKVTLGSNAQLDSNLDDASKGTISIENMLWFQENGDGASNGARVDGWQYISGSKGTDTEGDTNWYFIKKGKAKYATSGKYSKDVYDNDGKLLHKKGDAIKTAADLNNAELVAADTTKDFTGLQDGKNAVYRMKEKLTWSGKSGTFCFDQNGKMKTGLQFIGAKTYFFNDDGFMQTGKVSNVEEADGDTFNYYFNTKNSGKGQGFTGEKDGYLYYQGKRLEADDDYRIFTVKGKSYVVNNKGKLQKTFNKKDLELADGTVKEDVTLSINKKTYVIEDAAVVTPETGKTLTDAQKKANKAATELNDLVADNTVLPFIHLEDTDNYIIGTQNGSTVVASAALTEKLKNVDILTVKNAEKVGVTINNGEVTVKKNS